MADTEEMMMTAGSI